MRKIFLLSCMVASVYGKSFDIDNIIKEVKEPRTTTMKTLNQVDNPFVVIKVEENNVTKVEKMVIEEKLSMNLNAIMGKTAFVNGKWYKEGDVINGYTLGYVGERGVVLRKGNEIKKVFMKRKSKINFFEDQ